jgi:hypothetical protein
VLVQKVSAVKTGITGGPPGTSLSVALLCPVSPGNLLIVTGGDTAGALTTVAGAGVPMWKHAVTSDMNNNAEIWFTVVPTGSIDESVQISSGGTQTDPPILRMILSEWSGLAVTDPDLLDGVGSGSGRTSMVASASPITPKNTDLLVFDIAVDSSSFGAPMDWMFIDEASVPGDSTERAWHQIASSGAPQQPMVTVQSGHAWDAVIAAFKVAP